MNSEQFFQPLGEGDDGNPHYDDSKYIYFLNCLGRISNDAFYVIDYNSKTFLHVVSSDVYLIGRSAEQVRDDGFRHYERIVHRDDLQLLQQVNRAGYDFIHSIPLERRMNACLSYDLRIRDSRKNWRLVNQRLMPLELTPDGVVRLAVCKVGASSSDKPGNAMITLADSSVSYQYSEAERVFVAVDKPNLSPTAIQVIILSSQGLSEKDIARSLDIGVYTIKYHKKAIFKELDVKNIQGAVQWFNSHKVLQDEP